MPEVQNIQAEVIQEDVVPPKTRVSFGALQTEVALDHYDFLAHFWHLYEESPDGKKAREQIDSIPKLARIEKKIRHRVFELFILYSLQDSWVPQILGIAGLRSYGATDMDSLEGLAVGAAAGSAVSLVTSSIGEFRLGYYNKNYSDLVIRCLGELLSALEKQEEESSFSEHLQRFASIMHTVDIIRGLIGRLWVICHRIDTIRAIGRRVLTGCFRSAPKKMGSALQAVKLSILTEAQAQELERERKQLRREEEVQRQILAQQQAAQKTGQLLGLIAKQVARPTGFNKDDTQIPVRR